MNVLFILNDARDATGRSLNALRLACSLSVRSTVYVRIFLVGAALACARRPHASRTDADDAEALLQAVIRRGGDVRVCGTCAEAEDDRGHSLIEGTTSSSLDELSRSICESDRVLVF